MLFRLRRKFPIFCDGPKKICPSNSSQSSGRAFPHKCAERSMRRHRAQPKACGDPVQSCALAARQIGISKRFSVRCVVARMYELALDVSDVVLTKREHRAEGDQIVHLAVCNLALAYEIPNRMTPQAAGGQLCLLSVQPMLRNQSSHLVGADALHLAHRQEVSHHHDEAFGLCTSENARPERLLRHNTK